MSDLLGYIPFLTPLNAFFDWWYLLIFPLCGGISMIYKALRMEQLDHFWREVLVMTALIILSVIGLAIALGVFVQVVLPMLPVD